MATESMKISGKKFVKKSCSKKKTTAKAEADGLRKKGRSARVKKNGNMYCVYVGPALKKKKKASTKRKTRRRA